MHSPIRKFMKTTERLFIYIAMAAMALSCSKEATKEQPVRSRTGEIAFAAGDVVPVTKASVVTATTLGATGFNVSAAKGTPGSETEVWTNVAFSKSGDVFSGGKFWPFSDESYCFYAANAPLAFQAAGGKIAAANATTAADKDIVAAYLPYGTTSTTTAVYMEENTLTFRHIFARIGSVTVSAKSGYTVDNISISITPKISGDYNIRTGEGHTDATGWSSTSNGSPVGIAYATPGTKTNNLYLVPGTYTLTLGWRATKGEYVKTYSGVTKDVDIEKGNVNTISCTLGGQAQEIVIAVALNPWTSATVNGTLEEPDPHTAVDMGGTSTVLYAAWNVGATSETEYGDYFAWSETSKRYTNTAESLQNNNNVTLTGATFATDWSNTPYHVGTDNSTGWTKYIPTSQASYWGGEGSPDNKTTLDLSDDVAHLQWGRDWRMPTSDELSWLANSSNCNWTWEVDYNGSGINGFLVTSKHNWATLFLPCAGNAIGSDRGNTGRSGGFWSSSLDTSNPHNACYLYFRAYPGFAWDIGTFFRLIGYPVRAVKPKS